MFGQKIEFFFGKTNVNFLKKNYFEKRGNVFGKKETIFLGKKYTMFDISITYTPFTI